MDAAAAVLAADAATGAEPAATAAAATRLA
jgi:hypothetical protein